MGGGPDVDAAFAWWKPLVAGGDVVVLRASGDGAYDDYLYTQIGGFNSVETLLVTSTTLAESAYVAWKITHAEGIFVAGGDQAKYLQLWKGTGLQKALAAAWGRGAVIGGTSAGCDILGEFIFRAENGSVLSSEALADPYNMYMTMDRGFLALSPVAGTVLDTHFAQRDRMGRMVGFVARILADGWATKVQGMGIDEGTAVVVGPAGEAKVLGAGSVYLLRPTVPAGTCQAGKPLEYAGIPYFKLGAGDTWTLPGGAPKTSPGTLAASAGTLTPANPY